MTPEITGLLDKAKQSAEAAQSLLADNYVDFAASRAYYAMFYALEALLLTKSLSFSKHSAVISAFGKEYIKSGILDPCFHRAVIDAFDLRNAGDYGTMHAVNEELASQTIQNARELIQAVSSHIEDIQRPKGFTLVEMAIVLVVIGLLVGMGAGMIGPLTNMAKFRESREIVDSDILAMTGFAASNNRLPNATEFPTAVKRTTDSWTRDLIYLYDSNLYSTSPTKDTICGRKTAALTITDNSVTPATTISNVAFIILSPGEDATVQTTLTGTLATPPPSSPFTSGGTVPLKTLSAATGTISIDPSASDIVRWVTLDELRSKIGCQGAQLKIVNNELPYGSLSSPYPDVYIVGDGGLGSTNYQWCIENTAATAPAGLSYHQNTATGSAFTIFSTDCLALTTWGNATQLVVNGTPNAGGSHFFKIFVRDGATAASNNINKSFVLTINP